MTHYVSFSLITETKNGDGETEPKLMAPILPLCGYPLLKARAESAVRLIPPLPALLNLKTGVWHGLSS